MRLKDYKIDGEMIKEISIIRNKNVVLSHVRDVVAIEEPLEIQLEAGENGERNIHPLSVTMRTPGNDEELAVGFLFTEGVIFSKSDLTSPISFSMGENSILIRLNEGFDVNLDKIKRNFYTTSSCGVCGKESIEAIHQVCNIEKDGIQFQLDLKMISELPSQLYNVQKAFVSTGGIHAAALFHVNGELVSFREDVGRHNALDKLIGAELIKNSESTFQLGAHILLLSGRASFELIQKAAMAGIKVVCAIGAPSSLAVETAQSFDMTLIGFLKNESCNVYCGQERIIK